MNQTEGVLKTFFRDENTTDVWLTPLDLIHKLGKFDLDPAAYKGHKTAINLIYPPDDGLSASWYGRIWLNPPYGRNINLWVDKMASHGNGILFAYARVDTRWFHNAIAKSSGLFISRGRIDCMRVSGKSKGGASAPTMFMAFGEDNAKILKEAGLSGLFFHTGLEPDVNE